MDLRDLGFGLREIRVVAVNLAYDLPTIGVP